MSSTVEFINNQIIMLQSKIKEYNADIDNANTQIATWQAMIADWQSQIDTFNTELQKVQISDVQLTAAMGVRNAQPETVL